MRLLALSALCGIAAAQGIPGIGSVAPTVAPAIEVLAAPGAQSSNGTTVTTSAVNATGANLILLGVAYYGLNNQPACGNNGGGGNATPLSRTNVSDSSGNSYTKVWTNSANGAVNSQSALFCVGAPSVSSSMTFSVNSPSGQSCQPAIAVLVLANTGASSGNCGLDQLGANGNQGGQTSIFTSTSTLTPTKNNEILVSVLALASGSSSLAINDSFQLPYNAAGTADAYGIGIAYLIQTTATANHSQWTWTGTVAAYSNMASFFQ